MTESVSVYVQNLKDISSSLLFIKVVKIYNFRKKRRSALFNMSTKIEQGIYDNKNEQNQVEVDIAIWNGFKPNE